jgi:hypothetical protein
MKTLNPCPKVNVFIHSFKIIAAALLLVLTSFTVSAQGLVFSNPTLSSGTNGANGAVYRFSNVTTNIDALVTINGRSSSLVKLVHIDTTGIGHGKAFQPQVTYGESNITPPGNMEWWMEFGISFVSHGTTNPVYVSSFDVTALDVDGNNDKISEYVSFYNLDTYTLESNSVIAVSPVSELVSSVLTITGREFAGPVKNYVDIDTSATELMTTNSYSNRNSFRLRTGARSTGVSGAADRLYSFWFKTFTYSSPVTATLPLTLLDWNARLNDNKVLLSWATQMQKNTSHFVIERSTNGKDYDEAVLLFAEGNSDKYTEYSYNDKIPAGSSGVLYYRLRMVDIDGQFKYSTVRVVRLGKTKDALSIATYPNPVQNELRVTVPNNWQDKRIVYEVFNANGQSLKKVINSKSSQTENIGFNDLAAGVYVVKVTCENETAVKQVLKVK